MQPIEFYPEQANLTKGIIFGVMLFGIGQGVGETIGTVMTLAGIGVAGMCGYSIVRPAPCFRADAEGFSVMGKAKHPWSEYRGAGVHVIRPPAVPILCENAQRPSGFAE